MRALAVFILGSFLVASPARSVDFPPPTELEIEAKIKAVQQQQDELKKKEEQLKTELAGAKQKPFGGIKAEVFGVLKRNDTGDYIVMRGAKGEDQRVWLRPTDAGTHQQVSALLNREVRVTGSLQVQGKIAPTPLTPPSPDGVNPPSAIRPTLVPEHGLYLEQFGIDEMYRKALPPPPSIPVPPSLPSIPK
jgi:hypothetical protein